MPVAGLMTPQAVVPLAQAEVNIAWLGRQARIAIATDS